MFQPGPPATVLALERQQKREPVLEAQADGVACTLGDALTQERGELRGGNSSVVRIGLCKKKTQISILDAIGAAPR